MDHIGLARSVSDLVSYAFTNRRGRCATYQAVCGKGTTLLSEARGPRSALGTEQADGMLRGQLFGPGAIPLSNIGSMGGEYGPLGRRQSGKGRAVPVRCPSIVLHPVAFSGRACVCPAPKVERVVQSW